MGEAEVRARLGQRQVEEGDTRQRDQGGWCADERDGQLDEHAAEQQEPTEGRMHGAGQVAMIKIAAVAKARAPGRSSRR